MRVLQVDLLALERVVLDLVAVIRIGARAAVLARSRQAQAHQHGGELLVGRAWRAAASVVDVALGTTRLDEGGAEAPFAVEGDRRNPAALEVAAALQEGFALAIGEHGRGLGRGGRVRSRHRESAVET